MTIISLFDGSGGFPLAATICGMIPLYASEIEPYPIAVTRSRFPQMTHLGDVSRVNGAELTPADVVTFGSPCQSLSVAGKREGLRHTDLGDEETTRSGLFMEAVRIITEMRIATNGRYPRFAVWENVPGAFSSSNGDDFLAVLTALAKIADPEVSIPKPPKWSNAGEIVGDGWSLAWRVLDAQYFGKTVRDGDTGDVLVRGTPQCRRRIFLVADFGGQRAGEVLLERKGLPWNYPPCDEPWKTAAADAEGSLGADGRARVFGISEYESNAMKSDNPHSGIRNGVERDVIAIDRASFNQGQNAQYEPQYLDDGTNPTIVAKGPSGVCYCDSHRYIVRRLTPTECARLQGFPDEWGHPDVKEDFTDEEYTFWLDVRNTYAKINDKPIKDYTKEQMLTWYNKLHTDSAEYKMWGNGVNLPCVLFVMKGVADILRE